MRKNLLALSIAAMVGGLSGAANAQAIFDNNNTTNAITSIVGAIPGGTAASELEFNGDGVGNVLIVPYFTTNGGNKSLLNIVNTDLTNGKAVKLRYRNALNSDDVFDITIYLSPGDMWTADVDVDADGYSRLVTQDTSCTLPTAADIKAKNNGRFKTNRVLNNAPAQTREGYIEILNTADIRPFLNGATGAPDTTKPNPLWVATKHVNGKPTCNPSVLGAQDVALSNTSPNTPRERGYSWPTGGLFANWLIVNVADKASFSGEATALAANGPANLVWFPQTEDSVTPEVAKTLSADPLLASGRIEPAMYDFPDLSTPYIAPTGATPTPITQALTLSNQMAVRTISNEYVTNADVAFATDWVFSMPTRRYQIAVDYANKAAVQHPASTVALSARHFVVRDIKDATTMDGNVVYDPVGYRLCVNTGSKRAFDREESSKTTFVISPDNALTFCGETTILTFNNESYSVLGADQSVRKNIPTGFADGWFTMATPGYQNNKGLPVIGFSASKARGANLGGTWNHRVTR